MNNKNELGLGPLSSVKFHQSANHIIAAGGKSGVAVVNIDKVGITIDLLLHTIGKGKRK